MLGVKNLNLAKLGRMQQQGNLRPIPRQTNNVSNQFISNPFANISKTGTIDGNIAKNQNIIVNNGTINIGDNTGNVGNTNSNNGNIDENSDNNSNKNFFQQLIVLLLQLLQQGDNGALSGNNPFAMKRGNLFA